MNIKSGSDAERDTFTLSLFKNITDLPDIMTANGFNNRCEMVQVSFQTGVLVKQSFQHHYSLFVQKH